MGLLMFMISIRYSYVWHDMLWTPSTQAECAVQPVSLACWPFPAFFADLSQATVFYNLKASRIISTTHTTKSQSRCVLTILSLWHGVWQKIFAGVLLLAWLSDSLVCYSSCQCCCQLLIACLLACWLAGLLACFCLLAGLPADPPCIRTCLRACRLPDGLYVYAWLGLFACLLACLLACLRACLPACLFSCLLTLSTHGVPVRNFPKCSFQSTHLLFCQNAVCLAERHNLMTALLARCAMGFCCPGSFCNDFMVVLPMAWLELTGLLHAPKFDVDHHVPSKSP